MNTPTKLFLNDKGGLKMNSRLVKNLFKGLDDNEVLRIEVITGNKIYCLPYDTVCVAPAVIKIVKQINKKDKQIIVIDPNAVAVVCTMSRKTYDLKLQKGELYV